MQLRRRFQELDRAGEQLARALGESGLIPASGVDRVSVAKVQAELAYSHHCWAIVRRVGHPVELQPGRERRHHEHHHPRHDREDLLLHRVHLLRVELERQPLRHAEQDRQHADGEEGRRREVQQAEQVDGVSGSGADKSLIHSTNGWWRISTLTISTL